MKKLLGFGIASFALLLMLAPTAFASEFIAADKNNSTVTLSSGEVHHNTYVAGGAVFVNSDITGDLYSAGGNITVEGKVEQDVVVAGGNVTLNGPVGGDIRVLGGTIIVNGPVSGDVLMAGGAIHFTEKSSVTGDFTVAGGDISIEGPIVGAVRIAGGTVSLNSKLSGPVTIQTSKGLTVGPKAEVAQTISYKGIAAADVKDGAVVAGIDFQMISPKQTSQASHAVGAIFTIAFVVKVIGLLLVGLLLMKLFPKTANHAVEKISNRPWVNLGIGALVLFLGPVAVIIALLTIFGAYIAIAAFLAWLLMLTFSAISSSVFIGSWIVQKLTKRTEMVVDWQALLIGSVALAIATLIPFIGTLFVFIVVLIAFGAMVRLLFANSKHQQES